MNEIRNITPYRRLQMGCCIFIVLACTMISSRLSALETTQKRIIILNSYDIGYPWTADNLMTILHVLEESSFAIDLRSEFMDTKHGQGIPVEDTLFDLFKLKYAKLPIDLIITTDDAAFQFALNHRKAIFSDAPIVFGGLNNMQVLQPQRPPNVAGLLEKNDILPTINLALTLHPDATDLYLIIDNSVTGRGLQAKMKRMLDQTVRPVKTHVLSDFTLQQLTARLASLPCSSIVQYLIFQTDSAGWKYDHKTAMVEIHKTCTVPVYSTTMHCMGYGSIGGYITHAPTHGTAVAAMALDVLRGKDVDSIPIGETGQNPAIFDARELSRFGIDPKALPGDSRLLYLKQTFMQTHGNVIVVAILIGLFLLMIIAFLSWNNRLRQQAQASLKASMSKLTAIINTIPDMVFILDEFGEYMDILSPQHHLLFLPMQDLIGKRVSDLLPEDVVKKAEVCIRTGLESGKPQSLEYPLKVPAGECWFEGRCLPLPHLEKGRRVVLWLSRDITGEREKENKTLQAEKLQAIGQLAGGIAHDFNNMLSGIMGAAELLKRRINDAPRTHKLLDVILTASERAGDLTQKLLTFSRKQTVHLLPIDIHQPIREAVALLERSIDPRIEIKLDLKAAPSIISGDGALLQSAMLHLATNARDAMPRGGTLSISTESVKLDAAFCQASPFDLEPGFHVQVTVADTGEGMSDEVQEHIFEPFFTTKEIGKGTGLGLSAVYGLVETHSGAIEVKSVSDEGSRFQLWIPIQDEKIEQNKSAAAALPVGSGCILLIDDEPVVLNMAENMLEELGYNFLAASDGLQGLRILEQQAGSIEAVVLDLSMPNMSGGDVLQRIHKEYPSLPVIVASGYSSEDSISDIMAKGASAFLKKPFHMHEMADTLRNVIGIKASD